MWTSKIIKKQGLASIEKCFFAAWFSVFLCRAVCDLPVFFRGTDAELLHISVGKAVMGLLLLALLILLVLSVMEVGRNRFFLDEEGKTPGKVFLFFRAGSGGYFAVVKGMLLRYVRLAAGFLCLIVPGIMEYYRTFFVPWLLAENPGMRAREAVGESIRMTQGQKMNLFIMQLTFIGWFVAAIFIISRLVLFLPDALDSLVISAVLSLVLTYYYAAVSRLYKILK